MIVAAAVKSPTRVGLFDPTLDPLLQKHALSVTSRRYLQWAKCLWKFGKQTRLGSIKKLKNFEYPHKDVSVLSKAISMTAQNHHQMDNSTYGGFNSIESIGSLSIQYLINYDLDPEPIFYEISFSSYHWYPNPDTQTEKNYCWECEKNYITF